MPSPLDHPSYVVLGALEERLDGSVRPVPHPATDTGFLSLSPAAVPEEHALDESVYYYAAADPTHSGRGGR